MRDYVFGAAPVSPPEPVRKWGGLGLVWVGPDGSEWDLTDWAISGIQLRRAGVRGLHFPRIEKHKSASRAIPGSRLRGWHAEDRDVAWQIYLWGDGTDGWLERQNAFFSTIRPDEAGTWKVTAKGETRTLQCTGVFDGDYEYDVDPLRKGWALYPLELEAVQPFWSGAPVTFGTWQNEETVDFIDLTNPGDPDYHPSPVSTIGDASATNPGDVELWPVWTVRDQWDASLTLGVDGVNIVVPVPMAADDVLVIDTDPRHPTATMNGVDWTATLGLQSYATIPHGKTVPLSIAGTGTGSVTCSGTPLYFRAF